MEAQKWSMGRHALTTVLGTMDQGAIEPIVANSAGSERPKLKAPVNATDCHMHIYDGARFTPPRPESNMQPNSTVADYRQFQRRIGTSRVVVV